MLLHPRETKERIVTRQPRARGRGRTQKISKREQRFLEKVHLNAAGIDVGSESHWVAVPDDRDDQPIREFKSFTQDLIRLADWLEACGVDTVAMESTGVYWIPLYEILQERGIEVLLVNARHVKNVPGRKTDLADCQWIQKLHTFGLLRGSFRPAAEITAIRTLIRHREKLVAAASSSTLRMQKVLVLMNLQLHNVISDITGMTGIAILRDIVSGETDPRKLARHRHFRCRASEETIAASLTGHYREEHVFVLGQALELYDVYHEKIRACDEQIEERIRRLESRCDSPDGQLPEPRRTRKLGGNEPRFEIRSPLFTLSGGADLTQLPGIGPYGALKLISEIGLDMSPWPTEKHFVSWLTLAPNPKISGGKILSSRTEPSANRAAKVLRMAAMTLGRSDHALGAFYRRLGARIGKAKAITATARKLALLVYRLLKHKILYQEQTADEYDQRQRARIFRGLRKRASSLGFALVDTTTGLVME
jgi:transposase